MTPRRTRLFVVLGILGGVAASVSLAVMASRENIMFYYDPSQIVAGKAPPAKRFRIGGMVVKGSVARAAGDLRARDPLQRLRPEWFPINITEQSIQSCLTEFPHAPGRNPEPCRYGLRPKRASQNRG